MNQQGLTKIQRELILITQSGLPLSPSPFSEIAKNMQTTELEILSEFKKMKESGVLRRIAVVPNHYKLGFIYNGMTVWDVPLESVEKVGQILGSMSEVSHCYERPRAEPIWNFNIFAMIHGHSKDQVLDLYKQMQIRLDSLYTGTDILFSTKILKKTGLRIYKDKPDV